MTYNSRVLKRSEEKQPINRRVVVYKVCSELLLIDLNRKTGCG